MEEVGIALHAHYGGAVERVGRGGSVEAHHFDDLSLCVDGDVAVRHGNSVGGIKVKIEQIKNNEN